MKALVQLVMVLVVFAAAAAGGWFVQSSVMSPEPSLDPNSVPNSVPAETNVASDNPLAEEESTDPASEAESELMPVAVRPKTVSVEELLRFSLSLKERARQLGKDEESLQQRKARQDLVLSDIEGAKQKIDGLRDQLTEQIATAKELSGKLSSIKQEIVDERSKSQKDFEEIKSQQIEIEDQHRANDRKLSDWLQGMTPSNASAVLVEMANDGKMDVAVQILANFEEREAAKILDAIEDPKLLNQFITEFRNLKSSKKKTP